MLPINRIGAFVSALLLVGLNDGHAQPAAGKVPDPSPAVWTIPESANAPAPDWVRPGTRLVFFGGSSTIAGVRTQLVLDDNGNWVDQTTGRTYAERDVPSSGGVGYNVVEVGYVDRRVVALTSRLYPHELTTNKPYYHGNGGMVTNAGAAGDYWVNPAVLARVQEIDQQGVSIRRMPYVLNGRRYNAIRFQTTNPNGYTAYTYDLESGLLIFYGSRITGQSVLTAPTTDGGAAGAGRGSTQLATSYLVGVEQLEIPWVNLPPPPGLEQIRELQYQGTQMTQVQGAGQYEFPVSAAVQVKSAAPGWIRFTTTVRVNVQGGIPPMDSVTDGACGVASIGGLWLPTGAAGVLRPGQIIARDAATSTTISVTRADPAAVTITEVGPLHRLDYTYDGRSGLLAEIGVQQQVGLGLMNTRLRLVGTR